MQSLLKFIEISKNNLNDPVFIYMSTNKVYGDNPNYLELDKSETRYDLKSSNKYFNGIDTSMSIDKNLHSFLV